MKRQAKQTLTPKPTDLDVLGVCYEPLYQGIQVMRELMGRVQEMLTTGGEYDDRLASHYAWQLGQLSRVMGEARKLEAHRRRYGEQLPPEERIANVVAWLRTLLPEQVAKIRAAIADIEGEEPPPLLG